MGFFKRLFGIKEKEELQVITERHVEEESPKFNENKEETAESLNNIKSEREYKEDICGLCNLPIGQEKWKKVANNYVHKKCFKKGKNMVLNGQ